MICKEVLPEHPHFSGDISFKVIEYLAYAFNADVLEQLADIRFVAARKHLLHVDLPC